MDYWRNFYLKYDSFDSFINSTEDFYQYLNYFELDFVSLDLQLIQDKNKTKQKNRK